MKNYIINKEFPIKNALSRQRKTEIFVKRSTVVKKHISDKPFTQKGLKNRSCIIKLSENTSYCSFLREIIITLKMIE